MSEKNDSNIWKFVSPQDYKLPEKATTEKARSAISVLWHRLFGDSFSSDSVDIQAELKSIPQGLLDWVSPFPTWKKPANEIFSMLRDWYQDGSARDLFQVFVSSPGGGIKEILQTLAERKGWPVVGAPAFDQIVNGDFSWIDGIQKTNESPIVIPQLSGIFIRHSNGFEFLRRLIDKLFHSNQKCIIGCNSSLWRYLQLSMAIESFFPKVHALQSLDALQLERWFCDLEKSNGKNSTVFRQSDSGTYVLPRSETSDEDQEPTEFENSDDEHVTAEFLNKLAASSRGVPLTAWAMWRHSLKLAPGDDIEEVARDAAVLDKGRTIWVKPFEKIGFPRVPQNLGQKACFVLQYLLMHEGLSSDMLLELLKIEQDVLLSIISGLKSAGIIVEDRGLWRVTWLGLPEVRRFLAQEDYLIDLW